MLEDIKFDLQTLDYRALGETQWAELKARLERRARAVRKEAVRVLTGEACSGARRLASVTGLRVGKLIRAFGSTLARQWRTYTRTHRRRRAVFQLCSLDDRVLKDIGIRRCEIQSAVYRHDPSSFR